MILRLQVQGSGYVQPELGLNHCILYSQMDVQILNQKLTEFINENQSNVYFFSTLLKLVEAYEEMHR